MVPFISTACLDALAFGFFESKLESQGFEHRLLRDALVVGGAALVSYPAEVIWRRMVLDGGAGAMRRAVERGRFRNGLYAGLTMGILRNVVSLMVIR